MNIFILEYKINIAPKYIGAHTLLYNLMFAFHYGKYAETAKCAKAINENS
jgi:hypothetical protein